MCSSHNSMITFENFSINKINVLYTVGARQIWISSLTYQHTSGFQYNKDPLFPLIFSTNYYVTTKQYIFVIK